MSAIERCRTAALGGHVARCEDSARTRSSPTIAAATGIARSVRVLPPRNGSPRVRPSCFQLPYFHVVFTLPAAIADIAYQNKAAIYDMLFKASAETTLTIAADPKHLGAHIGITAVLHTWGSAMTHHPHVHMIVPGGGLSLDATEMDIVPAELLSPRRACSPRLFRRLFLHHAEQQPTHAGHLQFFGDHARLADQSCLRCLSWHRCAKSSGWSMPSHPSADPSRCCATCRAIPTALPSPTAGWSRPLRRTASPSSARIIASKGQPATRR